MDITDDGVGILVKSLMDENLPIIGGMIGSDGSPKLKFTRDLTQTEIVTKDNIVKNWKSGKLQAPTTEERMVAMESAILELMLRE